MDQPKPRLGSDVLPEDPNAQLALFSEQEEVGNVTCHVAARKLSEQPISLSVKGGDQNGSPPMPEDDKDGHYKFEIEENLSPRYKIHSEMGEGTFAQVLECWDREQKEMVAIKIVRSKYREAATMDVEVLQRLGGHEKVSSCCVQMRNWFDYRNHICIDDPQHSYRKIPKSGAIKVIDFGGAANGKHHTHIVSTCNYRAPEVILGLGWSYSCDIWSVGCILVELCTGDTLFETGENLEHLAMMEKVLGPLPQRMLDNTGLNWPEGATLRFRVRKVSMLKRLENLIVRVDDSTGDLIDLLRGLLRDEPGERLSPQEALKHPPFFHQRIIHLNKDENQIR